MAIQIGGSKFRVPFENVAALKATTLAIGAAVRTAGYFVAGDGGGADYKIVAGGTGTADDAFFINLVSGYQAKLQLPDPARMTVRQLGCVAGPVDTPYASLPDDSARIAIFEASSVRYLDLQGLAIKTTFHTNVGSGLILKKYYNGLPWGLSYTKDLPVTFKEEASLRDTSLIRDRDKSPVLDFVRQGVKRKFLFNGTSITNQGGDVDSHPLLTCQALGVDCVNMAWPGTSATYDVLANPFTADGVDGINAVKCLSMTEDDRLAGLALYGPTSAYDNSFDSQNKASEMTAEFRILAPFQAAWNSGAGEPISVVVFDHNHNDRGASLGTLTPESHTIVGITKGATTVVTVNALGTVAVGDAVFLDETGIANLNHFAGRVQAIAGLNITLNIDSSGFAGTFSSGTLYKVDRNTIAGAWEFLFRFILNCSLRYGNGDVKVVTSNSFSEYSHYTDDRLFFFNTRNIKAVTDKYRSLFGPRFAFHDLAYEMAMTLVDQGTFAGDGVHPTTRPRRQAIANIRAAWFMGGVPTVFPFNSWLPAGVDKAYADQGPAHFSRFVGGFGTAKRYVGGATVIYSNNFPAGALGSGWTTQGTAPVVVAAPWGGGEFALHSTAPANGASGVQRDITIGPGRRVELDFWLPQVSGFASLPVNQLVTLWSFIVGASGGYINQRLQIRTASTGLLARYFKTSSTDLTSMSPAPDKDLLPNTKYHLMCEMYAGLSADNLGAFLLYLDGKLIGGPYVVEDQGQGPVTKFTIGAVGSTLGDAFETYIGNVVVSELDVRDISSRLTADVATLGGVLRSINGEIIARGAVVSATELTNADNTLVVFTSAAQQLDTVTLTADRKATLSTTGAVAGSRFRVSRSGAGAFNRNVWDGATGLIKALPTGTWGEFVFNGSNWVVSAYGNLAPAASSIDKATAANIWTATADKVLTADNIHDSAVIVTLTDAATIAWDMALGRNFKVTLAGNRTLGFPTNIKIGTSGLLFVIQDATGGRTLATTAAGFFGIGGVKVVLQAPLSGIDVLHWFALDATTIVLWQSPDVRQMA